MIMVIISVCHVYSLKNYNNNDNHADYVEDKDSTLIMSPHNMPSPRQYSDASTQTLSTGDIVITKIVFEEEHETKSKGNEPVAASASANKRDPACRQAK